MKNDGQDGGAQRLGKGRPSLDKVNKIVRLANFRM